MKATPKGRGEHPSVDINGYCRRCGCGSRERFCPPGYWMIPSELREWDELTPAARSRMEFRLARPRSTPAKNEGSDGG